jgi:hypothetical protein
MKTLLITIALLVFAGCSEGFYFGEASHETVNTNIHIQTCFFPEDMTIARGKYKIEASAGDTVDVYDANKPYKVTAGGIFGGFAVIDMGLIKKTVFDTIPDTATGHFLTDTILVKIYHTGICTVLID